ncbi:Dps family protein [Solitalea canadensis]|uniref:DNA-binding ferritin-like protein (Oxidative damage protectant) n=1 Tax=Solitalea canadensis (strain ATCC 29591 / DSM 3403 / JCM 21819 / LMG 8368 / NBRC 15130 / NCIMB 12057 / USAM 9D) TaxID=929556 RepID=H8KM46_SOLCM|nr:Dps family protein [Solitalea canadensis]AFD08968.1 DNA-binding ferritin-like protein (oxidative damage protectant) [Solitalea canadensis DSM 3403]
MAKKSKQTNAIGLDTDKTKQLAAKLNDLLANYQVFYQNTRGYHWNIKGEKFFELHVKFEEVYTDSQLKIDEIAERIRTLGYTPMHSFSDYVKNSDIKEITGVSDGLKGVEGILNGYKILLEKEREILDLSADADDEGSNSLMSDYISQQEKLVWMYSAYLAR